MIEEDWDALLVGVLEEVKKWFAFTNCGEDADHHDHWPVPGVAGGLNRNSSEEEEHNLPTLRVLRELYGRERPRPTLVSLEEPRAPQQQQGPHCGFEKSRVQGAPQRPSGQQAKGRLAFRPSQSPEGIGPYQRLGLGPIGIENG